MERDRDRDRLVKGPSRSGRDGPVAGRDGPAPGPGGPVGESPPGGPDQPDKGEPAVERTHGLDDLVAAARLVLFDFDGPICRLFAHHKAERVATELVEWVAECGLRDLLSPRERESLDPHKVLQAVDRRRPGSDLVTELEERLTKEELRAAASAWPTAFADPLIRTWHAVGVRLAITTNNSPQVARAYLVGRGLAGCFEPHIYGRTDDLALLKPDPHCLRRALNATGTAPAAGLMIGDNSSDFAAARRAGVAFLGYASNEHKAKLLRDAGVDHIVTSLDQVLEVVIRTRGRLSSADS